MRSLIVARNMTISRIFLIGHEKAQHCHSADRLLTRLIVFRLLLILPLHNPIAVHLRVGFFSFLCLHLLLHFELLWHIESLLDRFPRVDGIEPPFHVLVLAPVCVVAYKIIDARPFGPVHCQIIED